MGIPVPAWDQVFKPGGQTQDEARAHHEQIRKQQEKSLAEQRKPGFVPKGWEGWILGGLPPGHPVAIAAKRMTVNQQPYDLTDLWQRHARGETL